MRKDSPNIPLRSDLLTTKLSAPVYRTKIVKRARLTERLNEGMQNKVTLLVAPAGYGKTTLLSEWLTTAEKIGWPVAWVSLDAEDRGILRFWSYIVAALQTIHTDFHFELSNIAGLTCDSIDCNQYVPLINQIKQIAGHFTLVLDDYHEVKDAQIHQSLSYLIDHLPENMHLVISSRLTPPIPFSRLRVRNQLVEINSADLSFTKEEAGTFLDNIMEVKASSEEIKSLNQMTEGWVAGLQLAGLTLKSGREIKGFLAEFGNSNRHIADYLTEEVLNHLEDPVKEFLIKTSILSKLSAGVCDYILEMHDSQETLLYLEKANLFIVSLDENRHWYRYHALFADYLRGQLQRKYPQDARRLHSKACEWLAMNDFPELAIHHALNGGENEKAAAMVETCGWQAVLRFDSPTVIQWINQLPPEIYARRLELIVLHLHAIFNLGRMAGIEARIAELNELAERIARDDIGEKKKQRLLYQVKALQAVAAYVQHDYDRCTDLSLQVLNFTEPWIKAPDTVRERDILLMGMVQHFLCLSYFARREISLAQKTITECLQICFRYNIDQEYVTSICTSARLYKFEGRLVEARNRYQDGLLYDLSRKLDDDLLNFHPRRPGRRLS